VRGTGIGFPRADERSDALRFIICFEMYRLYEYCSKGSFILYATHSGPVSDGWTAV
jgi:hypothetical protein